MRTSFCCLSVVLLAICGTASAARPAHPLASSRAGELILQFRDPAQSTAPLKRLGLSATRSLMNGRATVVTVPAFMTADQAIRTLRGDGDPLRRAQCAALHPHQSERSPVRPSMGVP